MIRHSLLCRLIMAFAARRVCTCGASKRYTASEDRERWYRRFERRRR